MTNRQWTWDDCDRECEHSRVWYEEKFIDGILTGVKYSQCTANKYHKIAELDECPFYEVKNE